MSLIGIISQMAGSGTGQLVAPPPPPPPTGGPVMLVMFGESNSGGQVQTSELTADEKTSNPAVQLLNVDPASPTKLQEFYDLHIGVNNNMDHTNLTPLINVGWHTQIGNRMKAGTFVDAPVYLVEGGHGGSQTSQWNEASTYYQKLIARIDAAKSLVQTATGESPDIYFLYTHGINDAINGGTAATFKTNAKDLISRLRVLYGNVPVLMPELMPAFHASEAAFNTAIIEMAIELGDMDVIDTSGATTQDAYHWSYQGMGLIADRMMNRILVLRS